VKGPVFDRARGLHRAQPRVAACLLGLAALAMPAWTQAQEAPAPPPARVAAIPPRLLEAPEVVLPEGAPALLEDTAVDLLLGVAADGSVTEATLAVSVRPDVDALVLSAARAMRFEPATRAGVPIPARIRFRYRVAATPVEPAAEDATTAAPPPRQDTPGAPATGDDATAARSVEGVAGAEEVAAEGTPEAPAAFGARAVVERPEPGATSRITLRGAELTTVPGTFGEPLRAVAALPGVARSPFGIGFFVVRGSAFNNTGFLVDGFPIPILYHFGFGPAVISSRFVERMRFYPGNYPVSYGRFTGGLVALDTHAPEARAPQVELSLDLLRASAMIVLPFDHGRGNVAFAFRRSYYELLVPLFVPGLTLQYTDAQLRAEYRFDAHLSGSIFLLASDDTLDQSGAIGGGATSSGVNTSIAINFQRAIARLVWRVAEGTSVTLAGTVGRDGQFFGSRSVGEPSQRFGLETLTTGLRLDVALAPAPWLAVNTGLDLAGVVTHVDVTAPLPSGLGEYPRPVFDPRFVTLRSSAARGTPGAYLEGVLRFAPVELSAGLRMDVLRYGALTETAPDPRVVARWEVFRELRLKAGTGLFTQAPAAVQTISTGGNPRLGPQRAWQTSGGVEVDLPLDVGVEVNGFYSQMWDIARFAQSAVVGPSGELRREFFRADQEGRAYGLEVLIRRPVDEGFYAWASYTLSRSERLATDGTWRPFSFDQTHVLNLVASYQLDGWRIGGRFSLATGRPTADIQGGIYDADANDYDAVTTGEFARLPTYHQLDVRLDRDFDAGPVRGTVFLEVLNAYYAQNAEGVIYQYDFERSMPVPGIPILGTLGVRAVFE